MADENRGVRSGGPGSDPRSAMGRGVDVLFGEGESRPSLARRATPASPMAAAAPGPARSSYDVLEEMLSEEAKAMDLPDEQASPRSMTPSALARAEYEPRRRIPRPPSALQSRVTAAPLPTRSLRIGGIMMDISGDDLASLVPPGPGEQLTPEIEIEPRDYTLAEQERILADTTLKVRLAELMAEIDGLYRLASTQLAVHPQHSGTVLKLLHQARAILVERPYAFADAELRLQAARTLVNRTQGSRQTSRRNWPWLFAYEILWALLLLGGLVFESVLAGWIAELGVLQASTMDQIFPAWGTMMAGGLGGVICALWSMWYHVSDQQDYDPQHNLWYVVQPLQGMVLGIVAYLVIAAGFLAMQMDISSPDASKAAKYLPWLVAAIAGIRQTFIYELLDRVMGLLTPGGKQS